MENDSANKIWESYTHLVHRNTQTNRILYDRDDVLVISIYSTTENQIACTISCIAYIRNTKRWLQSIQEKKYNTTDTTRQEYIKPTRMMYVVWELQSSTWHWSVCRILIWHVYISSTQSTTHETHRSPIVGFLSKLHISIEFMK